MAVITFDVAKFRALFPAFANVARYPDATLQAYWDAATCYVSDADWGWLAGDCRALAINQMTAHLVYLGEKAQTGQTAGVLTGSTIDKISVTLAAPPINNGWQFWLSSSPYGLQLWALLTNRSVGGFYVGGSPERAAFRKVGGRFWPW